MIGNRLSNTERRLESLVFKDARSRIIDFLRSNAETRGRKVGYETFFKHNLTQQDIANFTGTSRQTVTSVLNDLRKSNLIYFNRTGILIRDMSKLM
jgi:CRP-like cAMP-binding protein